jgi:Asp-tRNA(Asn)/Glu-tRNA(Gln) amidotransferase A subunit family amidase
MAGIPVHAWTLIEAARAIRDREISSRELTRALLSRIERIDPKIHGYITVLPETAI